ncbi:MAG: hypothetical protein V1813_01700 [Candidatus Aenigmatarchaeota archaeon]
MTGTETQQDVIKAISDKLAELEDLQLVNKLDIINVKNELDKSSLSGGPSVGDMEKISELRELVSKSDKLRKSERIASEIEEMKAQFDKIKKLDSAGLRHDFESLSKEFEELKGRVSSTEKKGAREKGAKLASPDLEELRQRIGKLESAHPSDIDLEIPEEIREELSKIRGKVSALEKSKPSASADRMEKVDELSGRIASLIKAIEEQRERITGLESSLSAPAPAGKKGKALKVASVPPVIVGRLDRLEKAIAGMRPAAGKASAGAQEKIAPLKDELSALKSKVEGLEKKSLKIPVPATAKASAGAQGQGLSEMRERMERIEKGLENASKLAMNLRPIEMPASQGVPKASRELELKIKDLEKMVGSGVGEVRFRAVEKKIDDIREWLPEYIDNKVEKKLSDIDHKVGGKVKEMESLKKEMIDSTIEQMLAQPSTVGKMLGEKIRKQVGDMQEKLKKFDSIVKPSDAKLTSLLRDIADTQKEIGRMREDMKGFKSVGRDELQDMGIEIKALATRLNSVHATASAKGGESSDVSSVLRDLEILKTKSDWLESTVHKLDLEKIYAKIDELEGMVRYTTSQAGSSGPIVLE